MKRVFLFGACLTLLCSVLIGSGAQAAEGNFSIQVSPSPLVATVNPGESKTLELKIRNSSTADEDLKIEARSFTIDSVSGNVILDDTLTPTVAQWLTLPAPGFIVKAGQWSTQKITVDLPKQSGFSYSFALIVSRNINESTTSNGQILKGSVAVFTLLNVNRPDATRSLDILSIETDKKIYEYLPATLNVTLKNTGNSIVQPYGNVFIQRSSTDTKPLATLPVNDAQSYILPGTERTFHAVWTNGFPVYKTSTDASGASKTNLEWDIDQIRDFRFGKYTAKVVAVYNDGVRDIPITGEVTFWVIPWKTILIILAVAIAIIVLFRRYLKFRTDKAVQKALNEQRQKTQG